jgi:hypothetical protein
MKKEDWDMNVPLEYINIYKDLEKDFIAFSNTVSCGRNTAKHKATCLKNKLKRKSKKKRKRI